MLAPIRRRLFPPGVLLTPSVLLAVLLLASCQTGGGSAPVSDVRPAALTDSAHARRIRAVTLDARRAPAPSVLDTLRGLGASHLTVVPFGFMPESSEPVIEMNTNARWYSESDAGIRTLAQQARRRGLDLILKPHLWVGHYSSESAWRDEIGFDTEAAWRTWETQYRRFLLHYARLAEETGADVLVVGTELARAVRERPAFWRRLIASVRGVYGGRLTYAANWYEEYEAVSFWDALDYVGVQAYFPLSDEKNPPAGALHAGWQAHCEALRRLSEKTGRPILFTEIGYRNVGYAAAEPWRWPERGTEPAADEALQARLYAAFFDRVWSEPWLAGAVVWKWHAGKDRRITGFTPQGKPAADVLRRGFGGM